MASLAQIRRLLALLEQLRREEPCSARNLADRLGVSRRTLFRDLRDLNRLGFDVRYDEGAGRYVMAGDPEQAAELPGDELRALLTLGQQLDAVVAGDESAERTQTAALPDRIALRHDGSGAVGGESVLRNLLDALIRTVEVRAVLLGDGETQVETRLRPYRLLFSHGLWYLAAADAERLRIRCVPVQSLVAVEPLAQSFELPDDATLELGIEAAWQTDVESGTTHEIVVRFEKSVARDVASRMWFRKQELLWLDDGSLEFRTHSALLDRVTSWVLSYGASATVIGPTPLREQIREQVRRMCEQHSVYDASA